MVGSRSDTIAASPQHARCHFAKIFVVVNEKDIAFAVASPKPATAVMPNLAATLVSSPNWALIRFRLAHVSACLLEPQYPCLRKPPPPSSPADFPKGLIFNVTKDCSSTRRRYSRLINSAMSNLVSMAGSSSRPVVTRWPSAMLSHRAHHCTAARAGRTAPVRHISFTGRQIC